MPRARAPPPRIPGALVGADAVYDTAFRRAGMLRVLRLEELFDAVQTLAAAQPPRGDRLAIVTNGGGAGVLATDALIDLGGRLAELAPETIGRLDRALPATWPRANPVDIIGDAPAERYAEALDLVMQDKGWTASSSSTARPRSPRPPTRRRPWPRWSPSASARRC